MGFDMFFRDIMWEEWKARYIALKLTGIFEDWSVADLTLLARYSRKVSFDRREVLVQQGEKCERMLFLLKGVCRVTKYPDVCARLERKLMECTQRLQITKKKNCFHHLAVAGCTPPDDPKFSSLTEQTIHELELEKQDLEDQLRHTRYSQAGRSNKQQLLEVGSIMPPGFCGEMSVLPGNQIALGSVVADTMVEVLAVHHTVFRTLHVNPKFLEAVQRRSRIIYPDDEHIQKKIQLENQQKLKQKAIVQEVLGNRKRLPR